MSTIIKEIGPGLHYAETTQSIIEVTKSSIEPDAASKYSHGGKPWAVWGPDNNYPQRVVDKATQDPTSMGALEFKIEAHYGGGLQLCKIEIRDDKEVFVPLKIEDYPEIDQFFFDNDIENFQQGIITDYEWWNRYLVEYITNGRKDKIHTVDWKRCVRTRKKKRNKVTGKMEGFYLSGAWPQPSDKEWAFVPAFDRRAPFAKNKAIYEHKKVSVDKDYYILPGWHSKMAWLEVAFKIPKWINANIENAINLKYHIEIPDKYFTDLYPREHFKTVEEMKAKRAQAELDLKTDITEALTGVKNVSKTFYTKFATDENGNVLPGWKITVLDNPLNDEAWLKADQTAASRICTAHGVPPSLAGIIIANTSSGSASDVREQFNYYLQLKSVIRRQTTLEWFYFVKRFNEWPQEVHLTYKQVILQSLDQNKSGAAKSHEMNPTSQAA